MKNTKVVHFIEAKFTQLLVNMFEIALLSIQVSL